MISSGIRSDHGRRLLLRRLRRVHRKTREEGRPGMATAAQRVVPLHDRALALLLCLQLSCKLSGNGTKNGVYAC